MNRPKLTPNENSAVKKTALQLVRTLQKAGFQAYFAGGCVRDQILGKEPKDIDIATSALPNQIEGLFEKTFPIGKAFGVIQVHQNGHTFEVATFRSDSGYQDGRRPDAVLFTHAADDALRRDFTINGLFYDPIADEIHDYVGGRNDLTNKLVRFIGDPETRIQEDHLRILRAVRFKVTLDFGYHPDTYHALKNNAALASKVSAERLRDELNKILMARKAKVAFEDLQDTGILAAVFPELEACKGIAQPPEFHHEGDVWTHLMNALESLPETSTLLTHWAVIFHDIGKPETFKIDGRIRFDRHSEVSAEIAERVLRRLKFSRKNIDHITWAVRHHFMMKQLLDMPLGRQRHWFLDERFPTLLDLFYADAAGTEPVNLNLYRQVEAAYHETLRRFPEVPPALLSGNEIMELTGLRPGPQIGELLMEMRADQLGHELETRKQAIEWLYKRV